MVRTSDGRPDAAESIEEFIGSNQGPADRALQMLANTDAGETFDLSTPSVAMREVRNLANVVGK